MKLKHYIMRHSKKTAIITLKPRNMNEGFYLALPNGSDTSLWVSKKEVPALIKLLKDSK